MADFAEVMVAATEMHNQFAGHCTRCPLWKNCVFESKPYLTKGRADEIADIILKWKENGALKYPSWKEVWDELFPDASEYPCPMNNFGCGIEYCLNGGDVEGDYCGHCLDRPIRIEVADKLGIEPRKENNND